MRIDMFVYNRCTTDARVLKEARTLSSAGHRVRIVAVLDETTAAAEEREGFRIVRIDRDPPHYRLLRGTRIARRLLRRPVAALGPALGRAHSGRAVALARIALAPLVLVERAARRLLLAPHKPLMFLDYYWRAYGLVRDDPPDALHAHDLNTLPVAAALARRLGLPLTYDAHELYPEISTLSRREAAIWSFVERHLSGRADHTLTVCDSIATEIALRYGVTRPTVLLNCPAAGDVNGGPPRKPTAAGAAAGEPVAEEEPVVLYQGGFAPHRGLETLVLAAHGLGRGTIRLMGWGLLEEELRALIAGEGLEDRVDIVGPAPPGEVVAAAARATVGVIPYEPVGLNNTYTTPNKLFDYMAAGLPVAASRLPELTRFVEQGEMGLTFTPGDPAALAGALNEILADPERYRRMRERSEEAGRRYTWEKESPKLLALYEERRRSSTSVALAVRRGTRPWRRQQPRR
jgi:glycosyltransferase involved in cell wall biosynthesis